MQEPQVEWLDKNFPDGYVIVYTQKTGDIRTSWNNPLKIPSLDRMCHYLTGWANAKEQEEGR